MDSSADRRSKLRIVVGPEVTIRFQVHQGVFHEVRITNLSMGGCFATLPRSEQGRFTAGSLLERFSFEHPELTGDPISAEVAYVLGGGPPGRGALELIGLGIRFRAMTPAMTEALKTFVMARA